MISDGYRYAGTRHSTEQEASDCSSRGGFFQAAVSPRLGLEGPAGGLCRRPGAHVPLHNLGGDLIVRDGLADHPRPPSCKGTYLPNARALGLEGQSLGSSEK